MYYLLRSILFLLPAEKAHEFTTSSFKLICKFRPLKSLIQGAFKVRNEKLKKNLNGLTFENPIGLAAGFDKNADFLHEMKALGFGFLEIGTVTPKPQPGNPKPRLFRLKKDQALINRMGFNNRGLDYAIERLKRKPEGIIIGGNIGKNKVTPNENATDDYVKCFEGLFPYVDYFVVNVSSPNTPNLRELQDKEPLTKLLKELIDRNNSKKSPRPIFLKIAPDISNEQLDDILDIAEEVSLDGIIASNTTISRDSLQTSKEKIESIGNGGVSGSPARQRSTEIIQYIRNHNKNITIIGVGGIMDEKSALEKIKAGADLIQLYTGFIYAGPSLIKRINKAVVTYLDQG